MACSRSFIKLWSTLISYPFWIGWRPVSGLPPHCQAFHEIREILRRPRLAQQVTLHLIDTGGAQQAELFLGFDAFGGGDDIQAMP